MATGKIGGRWRCGTCSAESEPYGRTDISGTETIFQGPRLLRVRSGAFGLRTAPPGVCKERGACTREKDVGNPSPLPGSLFTRLPPSTANDPRPCRNCKSPIRHRGFSKDLSYDVNVEVEGHGPSRVSEDIFTPGFRGVPDRPLTRTRVHTYPYTPTYVHTRTRVRTRTYSYVLTCVDIYTRTHTGAHTSVPSGQGWDVGWA